MKVYLDNNPLSCYLGFTMQNLKQLIQEIDERITVLQSERNILTQAAEIEERHRNKPKEEVFISDLRNSRDVFPEPEEIEKGILSIKGHFKAENVADVVKAMFPEKRIPTDNAIATALHQLIRAKKLEYERERRGRRPAIYRKA